MRYKIDQILVFWLFLMGSDLLKAQHFFEHLLKLFLLLSPYITSIFSGTDT